MSETIPKPNIFITPGTYQHYKGGLYKVISMALHSETLETMVVYEALYNGGGLCVRPASMFLENVQIDGQTLPRFKAIDNR
jgi:hypothetical protein